MIDEEAYQGRLEKLAARKWELLKKEKSKLVRIRKTQEYLLQKGYESDLILEALKKLEVE
jgi:regulatory protein